MKTKRATPDKPRLLFVIPSVKGGGAERVLINLANHFAQLDIQTAIVALNTAEPAYPIDNRIEVSCLVNRKSNSFVFRVYYILKVFFKLLKYMLTYRPDCAVSFITTANVWTGLTGVITGTPYIVSERTSPDRTINRLNYLHHHLAAYLYKKATAVVLSTSGGEHCLRKNKTFRNFTNINLITNAVPDFGKSSLKRVHPRKFILGVGRLAFVKGFDRLIAAFAEADLDDTDLLIVGDGEEGANLACQAFNLGLQDRVIFTGAKTELQNYYSQAEIFVLPSRNEGYPNALVEALSQGCPCIAVDCNFGPSEIINNEKNGLLIEPGNIHALAGAIIRLVNDDELKSSLSEAAKRINQTNSQATVLEKWDTLILQSAAARINNVARPIYHH
jgi:glycosyltransferase involved in cell wall biosynthesis